MSWQTLHLVRKRVHVTRHWIIQSQISQSLIPTKTLAVKMIVKENTHDREQIWASAKVVAKD